MTDVVVSALKSNHQYAVFEHLIGDPLEVIFIGVSRLFDVYRLMEAKKNSEWMKMFAHGGSVMVRIVHVSDDFKEAVSFAQRHMGDNWPRCNLHGFSLNGHTRRVRCQQNGEVYDSQRAAADALGISQPAVSRHMRGELSHVRGFTFTFAAGEG